MPIPQEATALIGTGAMVLVNIAGWIIASNKSKTGVIDACKTSINSAHNKIEKLNDSLRITDEKLNRLPCISDPKYMMSTGRLIQKVDNLEETHARVEKKLDAILKLNGYSKD